MDYPEGMKLGYTPNWDRMSTSTGYEVVFCPDHPRAWSTGYVYVHTIIAEYKLGRLLKPGEIVHHKDGNRKNNVPWNIEISNRSKHARNHGKLKGLTVAVIICPTCGKLFEKEKRQTHLIKGGKYTFCSRKCNGIFQRKSQLGEKKDFKSNVIEVKHVPVV